MGVPQEFYDDFIYDDSDDELENNQRKIKTKSSCRICGIILLYILLGIVILAVCGALLWWFLLRHSHPEDCPVKENVVLGPGQIKNSYTLFGFDDISTMKDKNGLRETKNKYWDSGVMKC